MEVFNAENVRQLSKQKYTPVLTNVMAGLEARIEERAEQGSFKYKIPNLDKDIFYTPISNHFTDLGFKVTKKRSGIIISWYEEEPETVEII